LRGIRPILKGLIETFEHPARVGPVRFRRNMGEAGNLMDAQYVLLCKSN
jgi:hypothetical protein